jgi:hypothetical protein
MEDAPLPWTRARVEEDRVLLGINEAVTMPPAAFVGDSSEARIKLRERAADAHRLHADAVRVQSSTWPWLARAMSGDSPDFGRIDEALGLLADAQLDAVVVVAPWPANQPWTNADDCGLDDPAAWSAKVTALVERYDRDGVDDAPGTARVRAWEVDNEPDLHDWLRPGFCPPATWAETVRVTAAAIKAADPGAFVVSGGIYRPGTATGRAWMAGVGHLDVDAIGIHLYPGDADADGFVAAAVANVRDTLGDAPIWVTEASTTGRGDGTGARAEDEQARGLVALVAACSEAGIEAVFWHTLVDPPEPKRGAVPFPGLLANVDGVWRDKPAAAAFAAMHGVAGDVTTDGDLRWIAVDRGWVAWPVKKPRGRGAALHPVDAIAGRTRETDGTLRIRGAAATP